MKILSIAAMLLFSGNAPAWRAAYEREDLTHLIERTVVAGEALVEAAERDKTVSATDRRDLKGQFALLLIRAGRCAEATAFISAQPEVKAKTISRVLSAALPDDRACIRALAPIMLARWDDEGYIPLERVGARFRAAAFMDGGGAAGAWDLLSTADREMQQNPDATQRWSIRFDALGAYERGPRLQHYLEYLAERMRAEKLASSDGTFRGITAIFALNGRCDLVAEVAAGGSKSCDEAERGAAMYREPTSDRQKELLQDLQKALPQATEESFEAALKIPDNWVRLTQLLFIVTACRKELLRPQ